MITYRSDPNVGALISRIRSWGSKIKRRSPQNPFLIAKTLRVQGGGPLRVWGLGPFGVLGFLEKRGLGFTVSWLECVCVCLCPSACLS